MADRVISPMLRVSPTVHFALYPQTHAHRNIAYSATKYTEENMDGLALYSDIDRKNIFAHAHTHTHRCCNIRITTVIKYRIVILCFMSIEMVI